MHKPPEKRTIFKSSCRYAAEKGDGNQRRGMGKYVISADLQTLLMVLSTLE